MWNYGKLPAKFLVSSINDIDTVRILFFFSSFTETTIKIPLKFPAFTFNKPKGWSISASNTETNLATFIVEGRGGGRAIKFCNTSGDHKKFTDTAGDH